MTFGELIDYIQFWLFPVRMSRPAANKFYDRRDFGYLKKLLLDLGEKDPLWFPRLIEPSTLGIRGWEYGLMFDKISFKNKKVLDVGPGSSRLPFFLAKIGAKVTMLDMSQPLEETEIKKSKNPRFILGDMTNIALKPNSFDSIICISAIEHVDMNINGFYNKTEYVNRSFKAIREMIRVLKPGGDFYLTTDFYLPKQKGDKWPYSKEKIRGAFEIEVLDKMIEVIKTSGVKLDSTPLNSPSILEKDRYRANYRGRFFSTFAFRGKKL